LVVRCGDIGRGLVRERIATLEVDLFAFELKHEGDEVVELSVGEFLGVAVSGLGEGVAQGRGRAIVEGGVGVDAAQGRGVDPLKGAADALTAGLREGADVVQPHPTCVQPSPCLPFA